MTGFSDSAPIVVSMCAADYRDTRVSEHTFADEQTLIRAVLNTPRPLSASTPRWSFGRYTDGSRSQATHIESCAIVYDWDHDSMTLEQIADRIPYGILLHTTGSHTDDAPRIRGIVLLAYPVVGLEFAAVWGQVRQTVPGDPDPLCGNWAQPWRCPADNGHYRAIHKPGPPLDPGPLLLAHAAEQQAKEAERAAERPCDPSTLERRAIAYVLKMDAAISGAGGHAQTFKVAAKLVQGFGLGEQAALRILLDHYNPRCLPRWTERELRHKVRSAMRTTRVIGRVADREAA